MQVEQLTVDSAGVAHILGYFHRDGRPNGEKVRRLYRAGRDFPPPIDPKLSARDWRWSTLEVTRYVNRNGAAA